MNGVPSREFMSCIGYLENTGSLNFANRPNWFTSHYAIAKEITFVNITINLIRKKKKYLRTGKRYQVHGGSNKFSKILLFTSLLKFYHWQQILVVAFLK